MKGLLQGLVMAGIFAGGALAVSCTEQRPETGTFDTPIQDKYQPPEAEAAEPLPSREEWMEHPSSEGDEGARFNPEPERPE